MKSSLKYRFFLVFAAALATFAAKGQESLQEGKSWNELLARADSLRKGYSFKEALKWYEAAAAAAPDSSAMMTVEDSKVKAQNAISMSGFCSDPVVVARRMFPLEDFYLFYPLEDGSWRPVPNQLDSLGGNPLSLATYFPRNAREILYSSMDETGVSNICRTTLSDTVWTAPQLINEEITSSSNEIYPMLSADGNSLFFASEGLYGMGGYDLYVSRRNEETGDWDTPVNMGFPYSSPFDDFLFINSPDGKFSIFASNRDCPPDSVYIYVVEYDGMPLRKSIEDESRVLALSSLTPPDDPSRIENVSSVSDPAADNPEVKEYMRKMQQVRSLRDAIASHNREMEKERAEYATATEADRQRLLESIAAKEAFLPRLNDSLSWAVSALQQIEMDFLMKGVVIDPAKIRSDASREVVGASSGYTFSKREAGPSFHINILKPKPVYDYTFRILPEGVIVEDSVPEGLVYQIQLFSSPSKASVKQVKGLSPVFEREGSGGRKIYSAGVFRTYSSALSNLNKVKRLGFKGAFITAFIDRESAPVARARAMESKMKSEYYVKIYPPDGASLPEITLSAIRQQTSKDLVKTSESGAVVFLAGPFADSAGAEALAAAIHATGVTNTALETRTVQP